MLLCPPSLSGSNPLDTRFAKNWHDEEGYRQDGSAFLSWLMLREWKENLYSLVFKVTTAFMIPIFFSVSILDIQSVSFQPVELNIIILSQ